MTTQTFNTDNLPDGDWQEFRKKVLTKMIRIDGPFTVETSEGPLRCEDGWLAIDARGYPYPIAADEQALIYEAIYETPGVEAITMRDRCREWLTSGASSKAVHRAEALINPDTNFMAFELGQATGLMAGLILALDAESGVTA